MKRCKINAGWYITTQLFTFLHITYGGMCLPIDNKNNSLDEKIHKEYIDIINKYKFNRQLKTKLFKNNKLYLQHFSVFF